MLALQGMTDEALCTAVPGLSSGEARKVIAAVHRGEGVAARPGLSRAAAAAVLVRAAVPELPVLLDQASARDPFRKLALGVDGGRIECVAMPLEQPGRVSVCVSSQVGCALACAFCATGRLGLGRNLEAWEMVEQVRAVARRLPPGARVHGVVFQGMGEPLANLDRVAAAIDVLSAPYAMAIDARAITVSTAGLPEGIRRLAALAPRVRLALSIGSARPHVRAGLMPVTRAHALDDVIDAAVEHARATGLAPMWAVTLLDGVNDGDADADALAALAIGFAARAGVAPRLSVLAYNRIDDDAGDPFRPSAREDAFRDRLAGLGVRTHRRYSGGGDIAAACGQLGSRI